MSVEENKNIIRGCIDEIWNRGSLALIDEVDAPDKVVHAPTTPEPVSGPAAIKRFVGMYRAAFPDLILTIEDMVGEGDKVAWRWTARGTHRGVWMGVAPTGRSVTVSGITLSRFTDGVWQEDWLAWDTLGLLHQLTFVPEPKSSHVTSGTASASGRLEIDVSRVAHE